MRQFFIFTAFIWAMSAFSLSSAYSQTPAPQVANPDVQAQAVAPSAQADVQSETQKLAASSAKVAFNEKKYVDPTYANLAHLYWALGILDVNDNKLVDNFMAITECKMYQTYKNNDLEWKEIREATKNFLRENYKIFPTNFKITIPIYLGSYNAEDEYFEVDQRSSAISSVRNIETIYNSKQSVCGNFSKIEGYPKNLILHLNRPFALPELPVEKELARLFLDEMNEVKVSRSSPDSDAASSQSSKKRMAYLQLMFRVNSYKESTYAAGGHLKAVVYAQIDYIKIFADYAGERLLYQKDMFGDENRKRRKRLGPITEEDLKLPDGPIFGEPKKKE